MGVEGKTKQKDTMRDFYTNTLADAGAFAAHYSNYSRDDNCDWSPSDEEGVELEHTDEKLVRKSIHRSRKDHYNRSGTLVVHKGRRYRQYVYRYTHKERDGGWDTWRYTRWLEIWKHELPENQQ